MHAMTPIRVRGKRSGIPAEKGKPNKPKKRPAVSSREAQRHATAQSRHGSSRKRRPKGLELSGLEKLPTEMIQSIFVLSANVDLPLASPRLAHQLESHHLFHRLTSKILHQILGPGERRTTSLDLSAATRLMDCKFFTWNFFREWLHREFDRLSLLDALNNDVGVDTAALMSRQRREEWTWYRMQPDNRLLPPRKLISRPFSNDKIDFLNFILSSFRGDTDTLDPVYQETAEEGLQAAVHDGRASALASFWVLGIQPDTELLRMAVLDARCDIEVVRRLVTRVLHLSSEPIDVDFLDPALWAWADRAKLAGDEKGPWLMALLRDAAKDSGRKDTEIDHAKYRAMVS